MLTSQQWQEKISEAQAKINAIVAITMEEKRELSPDEQLVVDEIQGVDDKPGTMAGMQASRDRAVKMEAHVAASLAAQKPAIFEQQGLEIDDDILSRVRVPSRAKARFDARAFTNEREAYAFGQWCLAAIAKIPRCQQWCENQGIRLAHSEGVNTAGGYLVPEILSPSIIRIVEEFGVFRANSYIWPMSSDTELVARRTGGLTVYYPAEGVAANESEMTFSQVRMVIKNPTVLTRISKDLRDDAVIDIANLLVMEFGLALATGEDQAGFNGDGSSTYGGMTGLKNALAAGSKKTAASGHTAFSTLTLADFHGVKALVPEYMGLQPKWYISSQGFAASMEPLQVAAGGNTTSEVAAGGTPMFLGSPVVKTQVLPTTLDAQVSTIVAYYGDLRMATTFGNRRAMTIASDASIFFREKQIAIMADERIDIVVHEPGTATVCGPIAALVTPAS